MSQYRLFVLQVVYLFLGNVPSILIFVLICYHIHIDMFPFLILMQKYAHNNNHYFFEILLCNVPVAVQRQASLCTSCMANKPRLRGILQPPLPSHLSEFLVQISTSFYKSSNLILRALCNVLRRSFAIIKSCESSLSNHSPTARRIISLTEIPVASFADFNLDSNSDGK